MWMVVVGGILWFISNDFFLPVILVCYFVLFFFPRLDKTTVTVALVEVMVMISAVVLYFVKLVYKGMRVVMVHCCCGVGKGCGKGRRLWCYW